MPNIKPTAATSSVVLIEYAALIDLVKRNINAFKPQVLTVTTDDGQPGYVIRVVDNQTWILRVKHEARPRVMRSMAVVTRILRDCGFKEARIELLETVLPDLKF